MLHSAAVDRQDWTIAKSASPGRVRQVPPEVRCRTLAGRMSRSGLVGGESDGQVDSEAEDHVLVVAELAGQPQLVSGSPVRSCPQQPHADGP